MAEATDHVQEWVRRVDGPRTYHDLAQARCPDGVTRLVAVEDDSNNTYRVKAWLRPGGERISREMVEVMAGVEDCLPWSPHSVCGYMWWSYLTAQEFHRLLEA